MDRSAASPPDRPDAPVVVGVDGSPSAELAVAAAAEEAARRGTRLIVLHAADPAVYEGGSAPAGYAAAHDVVDRAAAAARAGSTRPRSRRPSSGQPRWARCWTRHATPRSSWSAPADSAPHTACWSVR
ncbi:universal stress protein [Yinghuangia aomiensis]